MLKQLTGRLHSTFDPYNFNSIFSEFIQIPQYALYIQKKINYHHNKINVF
jgi:hypothetical protein